MSRTKHHNDRLTMRRFSLRFREPLRQKLAEHRAIDLVTGLFEAADGEYALSHAYVDALRTHHRGRRRRAEQRWMDKLQQRIKRSEFLGRFWIEANPRGGVARHNRVTGHVNYLGSR